MVFFEHQKLQVLEITLDKKTSTEGLIKIKLSEGEYMLAVVCEDHRNGIEARLVAMQKESKIPQGRITFQPVKMVTTDCVAGINEDYVDIELKRGVESDRKL